MIGWMSYRKIGGLHWLRLGRLRLCWCVARGEAQGTTQERTKQWLNIGFKL